ncbi:MAG: hypothetical protein AAFU73_01245, partial [Planctomycetota bacterium]
MAEALPPLQFALLVAGTEAADVPMVGGGEGTLCVGGTIGRYNAQIQQVSLQGSVGFVVEPLVIPLGGAVVSATAGDVFGFQACHRIRQVRRRPRPPDVAVPSLKPEHIPRRRRNHRPPERNHQRLD